MVAVRYISEIRYWDPFSLRALLVFSWAAVAWMIRSASRPGLIRSTRELMAADARAPGGGGGGRGASGSSGSPSGAAERSPSTPARACSAASRALSMSPMWTSSMSGAYQHREAAVGQPAERVRRVQAAEHLPGPVRPRQCLGRRDAVDDLQDAA